MVEQIYEDELLLTFQNDW